VSDSAPTAASGADGAAADSVQPAVSAPKPPAAGGGLVTRIALFLRQVIAELKKVVRPTRSELVTYTSVVVVFVLVVMAFVTVLDLGIGRVTLWVFGG
jgi:preprotein translocase subunit SecE